MSEEMLQAIMGFFVLCGLSAILLFFNSCNESVNRHKLEIAKIEATQPRPENEATKKLVKFLDENCK